MSTYTWNEIGIHAALTAKLAALQGAQGVMSSTKVRSRQPLKRLARRVVGNRVVITRLMAADRFIQERLQSGSRHAWLEWYRSVRSRARKVVSS